MTEISAHHAPPAPNSATESNGARLSTLMDELRELEENNRELEEEYRKFEEKRSRVIRDIREMQQKELEDSGRVKILVGFVETVERAHQYFDCKDYLAVTFASDKDFYDGYAFSSPIFRYVFLSRQGQYEMDLNPEQELQKIKMSSKDYSDSFILFLLEERRKCAKENGVVEVAEYDSSSLAKAKDKYRELLEYYSGKHSTDRNRKRADESLVRTVSQLFDAQHNA